MKSTGIELISRFLFGSWALVCLALSPAAPILLLGFVVSVGLIIYTFRR